jgi:hypothetical protein
MIQALKTNYTKEFVTTSLQNVKERYVIFIPPRRGMNQSQQYDDQSPGEIQGINHNGDA